jgi:hypothetical protein
VALNQKVKNLIQKLGEAIHESVSESEHIAGVVKNIRDQGFDVMLMLEATIGLNQVETESEESPIHPAKNSTSAPSPATTSPSSNRCASACPTKNVKDFLGDPRPDPALPTLLPAHNNSFSASNPL